MAKAAKRYRRQRPARAELGEREKHRLLQLGVCLILFFTMLLARGTDRLGTLREELTRAVGDSADFRGAFVDLSWSLASGRALGKTLGGLWRSLVLPTPKASPEAWRNGAVYENAWRTLNRGEGGLTLLECPARPVPPADPMARSAAIPTAAPSLEPTVSVAPYTGPALPDNTTMDRLTLGLEETVTPVLGRITSPFGWREHPIEGGEKFHCGVDVKADTGTPVRAFAAGKVDYIGESDVYGQYLQLRHANGVTSFYAHCSKLCVQQGQRVKAGEKVAESGATGEVTGPHLHLEMKKDGVRLDPAYYIEALT